ncbi:MAG TPA: hypothetical protein PLG05_09035 [Bacteroidales bacterium]|nr:hypothetical protein [Bacteroidales bacterium]HPL05306.1 hypothetical protein [Bacteroidales bacterium]
MPKEKKVKTTVEKDFEKEYSEIFSILGINVNNIKHEWNKEGDNIKEFNLYEDHPTPILTPNTHSVNY